MKSIIITGSSGFIGKNLKELLERDYKIIEFDKGNNKDITKIEDFENLNADYVVHLAALMRKETPQEMLNVNVLGTLNVLEFCRKTGAKLIFISSSVVYGNVKGEIKEDYPLKPESFYGLTKLIGEEICKFYNKNFNVLTIILRFFNAYGKGQRDALIPEIISQLSEEKIVLRNPYPKKDFVYVEDIVEAINKSLNLNSFEIINIGTGKSYSVREIAETLVKLNGKDKKIEFLDDTKIDIDSRAIFSKAEEILKWQPTISLEEGLKKILQV
jgi:UDP-glucose 4-epimerase